MRVTEPPPQRVEVNVGLRTMLLAVAVAGAVGLAILSLGSLLSIFVAGVLALGLDPVVSRLVKRGWPRGRAALVVFSGLFVGVFLIVVVTVGPLWDQVTEFVDMLPEYWDQLTADGGVRQADQQRRGGFGARGAGGPGQGPARRGEHPARDRRGRVRLGAVAGHAVVPGPVPADGAADHHRLAVRVRRSPAAEARWRPVLEESIDAISDSLIGNVAISLVAATVAGLSAWAFGLPFPIVLAVIVGFLDLIPQVGATIAAVILVLVALTVSTPAAIAMGVIQLIYQQIENYVVYPLVYRKAVSLSPFTTIVAVLIASSILGVVGAILAVPFAAVIKIMLREGGRPRRERMAALRTGAE